MKLIESLREHGADIDGAMERVLDDIPLYEECVIAFIDDPTFSELGNSMEAGDGKRAFDNAHTLKGVSANLGLNPLLPSLCPITELLRSGVCSDEAGEKYRSLGKEYIKLRELVMCAEA